MAVKIDQFIALQEVDRRIRSCRRDLVDLPRSIERSEREVAAAQARLEEHLARLQEQQLDFDKRLLDVRQIDDKILKYEVQLNSVKTNKEFSALQNEIASERADKERIDDGALEIMEKIEELKAETPAFQAKIQAAEKDMAEVKAEAEAALADRRIEIEALEKERAEVSQTIDVAELLDLYERMRGKFDGEPMAILQGNNCQGCYMSVPPNVMLKVRARHAGVQCGSCGRLLYVP